MNNIFHIAANRNCPMGSSKGNYSTMDSLLLEAFLDELTAALPGGPAVMEQDSMVLKRTLTT